jgi:hypothetical protein
MAESQTTVRLVDSSGQDRIDGTLYTTIPTSSGALSTQQLVSTTGAQINTTRSVHTFTPCTYDATNNVASLKVELSPDGSTYSTLATESLAAAVNNTGAIVTGLELFVPAGWYVKLTTTHATLGVTTYW